ncbi:hypothetical protein IHE45_10G084200 [Dioscorea alata]|uniref:Uncharacterized protein n=1 Tax=Dioscorea alata TaxID=55571 RepID=A0ACB7VBZ7_DIOAL|nr:hypothetical protein IHE45_10G084200 [Dioscorea alata]
MLNFKVPTTLNIIITTISLHTLKLKREKEKKSMHLLFLLVSFAETQIQSLTNVLIFLFINKCTVKVLQGVLLLSKPMELCCLEGPEGGMGIALGKKPRKYPGFFMASGFTWNACMSLEPWQHEDSSIRKRTTRIETLVR